MKTVLYIDSRNANAFITSDFLMRGDNIDRFRASFGRLKRKVRSGVFTSIAVAQNG